MRLLFISNFYPPVSRGGFEEFCQEVLEGLRSRGHDVGLLTTSFGKEQLLVPDPDWVHRVLHMEMELASLRNAVQFFTHRKQREKKNIAHIRRFVAHLQPDIVVMWGMWNIQRAVPALVEELMADRVAYYMGDYWPTLRSQFENYWNTPARNLFTSLPKAVLKPLAKRIMAGETSSALRLKNVIFPSAFMAEEFRRKGIVPEHTRIVYSAMDLRPYVGHQERPPQQEIIHLLYLGRLSHEKGVHTAIEAVRYLVCEHGIRNLMLTIAGYGEPAYIAQLHDLVRQHETGSFVTILPPQPKENVPALYHQADIFLFTSIWPEPFGRVLVEAMATGVAVVGTAVGGAAEILIDNVNALTFLPGNAVNLGQQVKRLIESPSLRAELGRKGREIATKRFDLQRSVVEIESFLKMLAIS